MLIYNTTLFETELKVKQKYYRRVNLEESMRKQIMDARNAYKIAYVNFFNDGSVNDDEVWYGKNIRTFRNDSTIYRVKDTMVDVAKYYASYYEYDALKLNLLLGLVFKKEDVDDENHIKQGARPINGIVRIYTEKGCCYLNGKQVNERNSYEHVLGFQSYANYDEFVKSMIRSGLKFNGPNSFKDFVLRMATGVPFEISISMNLKEETVEQKEVLDTKEESLPVLEPQPEQTLTRKRCLFKKKNK